MTPFELRLRSALVCETCQNTGTVLVGQKIEEAEPCPDCLGRSALPWRTVVLRDSNERTSNSVTFRVTDEIKGET